MTQREIRFRAWNKKTKQLEYVLLICFVNRYVDVLPDANLEGGNQESWSFDDIELMQSPGLKDVDGMDAFVGDIFTGTNGRKWILCGDQFGYWEELLPERLQWNQEFTPPIWEQECKIIGNIYEHPELLES